MASYTKRMVNLDPPDILVEHLVEYKFWLNTVFAGVHKDDMRRGLHHRGCFMNMMRIPGSKQVFLPYWCVPMNAVNVDMLREIHRGTTMKDLAVDLNLSRKAISRRMEVIHSDLRAMRFQRGLSLEAWLQLHAERRGAMPWELRKYEGLMPKEEVDYTYLEVNKVIERLNRNINKSFGRSNT